MKPLVTFLVLTLAVSAQAEPISALILDGKPVSASSDVSKSMVHLNLNGGTCSGVVISPRHILTAGHCVVGKPPVSRITVTLGASRKKAPKVTAYQLHSNYGWENSYVRADLAVLKLEAALPSGVVPAPIAEDDLPTGTTLITAGYGYSDRGRTALGQLLQSEFKVGTSAAFNRRFSDGSRLLRIDGKYNLCQGDSGGATFRRTSAGLRTVGIHSMADCDRVGYDVFAPDYRGWVTKRLAM